MTTDFREFLLIHRGLWSYCLFVNVPRWTRHSKLVVSGTVPINGGGKERSLRPYAVCVMGSRAGGSRMYLFSSAPSVDPSTFMFKEHNDFTRGTAQSHLKCELPRDAIRRLAARKSVLSGLCGFPPPIPTHLPTRAGFSKPFCSCLPPGLPPLLPDG